ncbi:MAG: sensor histidine kinase [Opitutaceae bacterium]
MAQETVEDLKQVIQDLELRLEIALMCANQVWWEWDIPSGALKTHAVKDCILGYDLFAISHHQDFWFDAVPEEEREVVWRTLREHFDGKVEIWELEHRYRNPKGVYKWVLEMGKVVSWNSDGSPLRMVGITQAIHEKKMKDQELKEKNDQLTAALKLKDVVLASASHDVKNTLNAGWAMLQLLETESFGSTEEFSIIQSSLGQSIDLISSIHELASDEMSVAENYLINIEDVINESAKFHRFAAEEKNLDLNIEVNADHRVILDGLGLRRILDNLLGNAIKFTDSGRISIVDRSTEADVIIEVSDTGSGIPEDRVHLLFVPFTKLSDKIEGSGLGLSICERLAAKMDGSLTFQHNVPTGSVFTLSIPRPAKAIV